MVGNITEIANEGYALLDTAARKYNVSFSVDAVPDYAVAFVTKADMLNQGVDSGRNSVQASLRLRPLNAELEILYQAYNVIATNGYFTKGRQGFLVGGDENYIAPL